MAALTRVSICASALALAMAAGTTADADLRHSIPADEKLSPGLRAAYLQGLAAGGDVGLQGICDGEGGAVRGVNGLLVMLEPGAHVPRSDVRHTGPGSNEPHRGQAPTPCHANRGTIAGLTVTQCDSRGRFVVLDSPGALVSVRRLGALLADPAVSHVEADCRYALTGATSRPAAAGCPRKFPCQPGSPRCAAPVSCNVEAPPALPQWTDGKLWGPESIGALNVYDALPDMSDDGLLIAVLDSGVFYDDAVFAGRIWDNAAEAAGTDGVDDDNNGCVDDVHGCAFQSGSACDHASNDPELNCDPLDLTGHGSMVAEIIVALGPGKILPVRLGNARFGFSKSDYVAAIDYVDSFAQKHPGLKTIVNLSQTMAPHSASAAIGKAIADSPSLFVIAAGNFGDVEYPAAYGHDNIIRVSAIGPHACNEPPALTSFVYNDQVDLVAPGTEICTSFDCPGEAPECLSQGTSLAAPHVTAAAAMFLHENPSATARQTRATLIEQAGALKSVDISFLAGTPRRCACDTEAD